MSRAEISRGVACYRVRLDVPHYEARNVAISFENGSQIPKISADGPSDSPHRYSDGCLCIWYPNDPPELRWTFKDGLLELINHIQRHLLMEAYWRESGEWLGREAPHGPPEGPLG